MTRAYEPPFEYSMRAARMRDAEGSEYAKLGEHRDRELEDFLGDLDGRLTDVEQALVAVLQMVNDAHPQLQDDEE